MRTLDRISARRFFYMLSAVRTYKAHLKDHVQTAITMFETLTCPVIFCTISSTIFWDMGHVLLVVVCFSAGHLAYFASAKKTMRHAKLHVHSLGQRWSVSSASQESTQKYHDNTRSTKKVYALSLATLMDTISCLFSALFAVLFSFPSTQTVDLTPNRDGVRSSHNTSQPQDPSLVWGVVLYSASHESKMSSNCSPKATSFSATFILPPCCLLTTASS